MRILFLCTGNSARSQMAEGFARRLAPPGTEVSSAGIEPRGLHPEAVGAMRERGVDISNQRSKAIEAPPPEVDLIVTLCGDAAERCPTFSSRARREHWEVEDPARAQGSEQEVREVFRRVRDDIEARVRRLVATIPV